MRQWLQVFGSDLDALIAECGPRFWLCGHVAHHASGDDRFHPDLLEPARRGRAAIINPDFLESYVVEL